MAAEDRNFLKERHISPSYTPAQPYSDKQYLESPRLTIPPPILKYDEGKTTWIIQQQALFDYVTDQYGDRRFLKSIRACGDLRLTNKIHGWQYHMRRQAQAVLPFLYLGPSCTARNLQFIKAEGITLLVAVRSASAAAIQPALMNPFPLASAAGIECLTMDLDTPYELRRALATTIKQVNDHLKQKSGDSRIRTLDDIKGKVLVYCESGNHRSTALVAAYLMVVFGIDTVSAFQSIQSQRFCITPDDGMKHTLHDLDTYLRSEREVATSKACGRDPSEDWSRSFEGSTSHLQPKGSSKRTLDVTYEGEEEADHNSWDADVGCNANKRVGSEPFTDVMDYWGTD